MLYNEKIEYCSAEKLHHNFCCKVFSVIPDNKSELISRKNLKYFFDKIDEISEVIKEYNSMVKKEYISEENIPIKVKIYEIHLICSSIYDIKGIHIDTIRHLMNVKDYSGHICARLRNDCRYEPFLSNESIEIISMAGFMHDISKLIIEPNFLYGGKKFNEEDKKFMYARPLISNIMLDYIKLKNKHLKKYIAAIKTYVIEHHENMDGTGYPNNKIGDEISLGGKIIRVADTFDAMTDKNRKYKDPLDQNIAIAEIFLKDNHYDKNIALALSLLLDVSDNINNIIKHNF